MTEEKLFVPDKKYVVFLFLLIKFVG